MQPQRMLRYLPENYQLAAVDEGGALFALLNAMDSMHRPAEQVIGSLGDYVHPFRAPPPFVLMQASWLDLDCYFSWSGGAPGVGEPSFPTGIDQLRLLVAEAPGLRKARGTRRALTRFLEVATGIKGFTVEDMADLATTTPFHVVVHVPSEAERFHSLIDRIVANERPAHATYELRTIALPALSEDPAPISKSNRPKE